MNIKKIRISIIEDELKNELSEMEFELIQASLDSIKNSYSPYSNFKVGSAVLLANKKIITGTNQENAVYPLGLCAERVAIFSASHQFPDTSIEAIAVASQSEDNLTYPCGSCRHVITEYEHKFQNRIKLFVVNHKEINVIDSVSDILPFAFGKTDLEK